MLCRDKTLKTCDTFHFPHKSHGSSSTTAPSAVLHKLLGNGTATETLLPCIRPPCRGIVNHKHDGEPTIYSRLTRGISTTKEGNKPSNTTLAIGP